MEDSVRDLPERLPALPHRMRQAVRLLESLERCVRDALEDAPHPWRTLPPSRPRQRRPRSRRRPPIPTALTSPRRRLALCCSVFAPTEAPRGAAGPLVPGVRVGVARAFVHALAPHLARRVWPWPQVPTSRVGPLARSVRQRLCRVQDSRKFPVRWACGPLRSTSGGPAYCPGRGGAFGSQALRILVPPSTIGA